MRAVATALALAAAVLAPAAWAQDTAALRPCRTDDVPGVWDVVRLRASPSWPVDRSQPDYFQYQRYVFTADGHARHLTATMPIGPVQHAVMVGTPATTRWTVDERGWLTLDNVRGTPDVSQCQVVERPIVDSRQRVTAMPGELLLTHYSKSTPVMRRQLAKHPTLTP
jgi:hypothetical protein